MVHSVRALILLFQYISLLNTTRTSCRGWTLQELIAPSSVQFYDQTWKERGSRATLAKEIREITKINWRILQRHWENARSLLDEIPVAARMAWASKRQTTRDEDIAYCLLGLFDINMPLLYGEGTKAFIRLQEEIIRQYPDRSIFAWADPDNKNQFSGILATSPALFRNLENISRVQKMIFRSQEFSITNRGVRFESPLGIIRETGEYFLPLDHSIAAPNPPDTAPGLGIYLRPIDINIFVRSCQNTHGNPTRWAHETTFQVARSISNTQIKRLVEGLLHLKELAPGVDILDVFPRGSFDPSTRYLYTGCVGDFLGYMRFGRPIVSNKDDKDFFVLILFRELHWKYALVSGADWLKMKRPFIEHFREYEGKSWDFVSLPLKADLVWSCAGRKDLAVSATISYKSVPDILRIDVAPISRRR